MRGVLGRGAVNLEFPAVVGAPQDISEREDLAGYAGHRTVVSAVVGGEGPSRPEGRTVLRADGDETSELIGHGGGAQLRPERGRWGDRVGKDRGKRVGVDGGGRLQFGVVPRVWGVAVVILGPGIGHGVASVVGGSAQGGQDPCGD